MDLETKTNSMNFDSIKKYAKKIGLLASASALFFLAGCAQELIQYRARIQTKPPEEVTISIDDEAVGKTSKTGPIYVESDEIYSKNSECKISLKANKYDAFFIMRHQQDLAANDGIITLDPKGRSQHCLEARVTRWEKGPSYNLLFEIPAPLIKDLYGKYTEGEDEIKEESQKPSQEPEKIKEPTYSAPKKEPYTKPEASKEPSEKPKPVVPIKPETPADIGKLVDELRPVEFFAAIGAGNTFGGLGATGGVMFNLGEIPSIELSLGIGYMLAGYITTPSSSEFNTVAVEGNAALNLAYWKRFKGWSFYLKGFGGIQGKAVGKTDGRTVEEKLLFGMGLIGGHKWVFADKYFILFGTGLRYTFMQEDFGSTYKTDLAIELGTGIKF